MSTETFEENLRSLGLTKYESKVLSSLYSTGKAKATDISKASGVPKAKIYKILDNLCNERLVRIHSTRPKTYSPLEPEDLFSRMEEIEKDKFWKKKENIRKVKGELEENLRGLYERSKTGNARQELIEVISLGKASLEETRRIISESRESLCFMSQSFEYLDDIEEELDGAIDRGVEVKIILSTEDNAEEDKIDIYRDIVERLRKKDVGLKFTDNLLNIRYTLADPERKGSCGCVLVVKEYGVPLSVRNAIFSKNQSLVKGLEEHFNSFL